MMVVIGLTGGIGSGKSTVAAVFKSLGIDVIDADQLARDVVDPETEALAAITERYGPSILQDDRSLNRKKLREIVFSDPQERSWLEQLTHPLIAKLMTEQLAAAKSPYAILESPLLLETHQKELVDRILVVDVDEATQLSRSINRDGGSEKTIKAIIDSQLPREKRLEAADDVIDNRKNRSEVEKDVYNLHDSYLRIVAQS